MFAEVGHQSISVNNRRDGGFPQSLKLRGWRQLGEAMHWIDYGKKQLMSVFYNELSGMGGVVRLPPTTSKHFVGGIAIKPQ